MKLPSVASLSDYGGVKQNFAEVTDPVNDEDADDRNDYVGDVAGMTQTVARAWVRFVGNATTPTDPVSNVHGAVWGNLVGVKPAVTRTGTGVFLITWPTTTNDDVGTAHTTAIRGVQRPNLESSTLYHAQAVVTSANTVTVYIFNSGGSANDAVGVTINVAVW